MADSDTFRIVDPPAEDAAADPADGLSRSDLVGISLSVLCAIHCAATPVLIALLPTLGLSVFEQPWVHQSLFVGCFLLAGHAVLRGFRIHGRRMVPGIALAGLGLLAASAFIWPAPCCTDGTCGSDASANTADASHAEETAESSGLIAVTASPPAATHATARATARATAHTTADAATHAHANCSHCVHEQTPEPASFVTASSAPSATPRIVLHDLWLRLMTPLGGILLVVAHGLNIRWTRDCSCGCCTADSPQDCDPEQASHPTDDG